MLSQLNIQLLALAVILVCLIMPRGIKSRLSAFIYGVEWGVFISLVTATLIGMGYLK